MPDEDERPHRRMSDQRSEPSIWEIADRVSELKKETREGFDKLEKKIERLEFVPMALYISERDTMRAQLAAQEDDKKWARRTSQGAVITAVISILLTALAVRGGL